MQTVSDKSDAQTVAEIKGHVKIPSAIVIALVTAMSTGAVTLATRAPSPPADTSALAGKLTKIEDTQRLILERINEEAQASRNRDVVQDASIAALRNR